MPPPILDVVQTRPWWQDKQRRDRALLVTFATLALLGILFVAFTNYLFAGDQRVMVVTMIPNAGQEARQALKDACGDLPGIRVVADAGDPDPRIQGRFPVRFRIADTTHAEEAALIRCLNQNRDLGVLGYLPEKDGN